MLIIAGIFLLIAGVSFPLAMLFWLNGRLNRKPALSSRHVGLLLALNGVLPVGLVTLGLGLLSSRLWTSYILRTASLAALIASALLLIALIAVGRRKGASDGR
jgi:uncharacterized protein involved in response to NO